MRYGLLTLVVLFVVLSCSTLSQNNVEQENIRFVGGVHQNEKWDDPLVFNRVSWFHGLTLYYEALIYEVDPSSKFFKWFAESEKEHAERCHPFLVSIIYSADPDKISHSQFRTEMEDNGFTTIPVLTFARAIKAHPHYKEWNLSHHRVMGFCRERSLLSHQKKIKVSFPSFMQVQIDF